MEHLLSLGLEEKPNMKIKHDQDTGSTPQSRAQEHHSVSEVLTSTLSFPAQHDAGEELVGKLTGVLHQVQQQHPRSVVHTSGSSGNHKSPESQRHEGLGEKLMNVFDSHRGSKPVQTQHTQPPLSLPQSKHQGLLDGLSDIFEGKETRNGRQEEEKAERQRLKLKTDTAKHAHLPLDIFEKLGFGNPPESKYHSAPPSKANGESLLEQLGSKLHPSGGDVGEHPSVGEYSINHTDGCTRAPSVAFISTEISALTDGIC
ncbi:hypothetical protein F5879DRAFT_1059733 [Lentinula edodes]|nr:hypothetical protein F5879DRAFT_1059733 [Lentinula edodes]